MPDSILSLDWFEKGKHDLESAKIISEANGYVDSVGVLLQQALEKYLKGYLLAQGWQLKKIHDLRELLFQAKEHNTVFGDYIGLARTLTAIYIEEKYPSGPSEGVTREEMTVLLAQTEKLIALIKSEIP
jgi:HEPN domain-containing protein